MHILLVLSLRRILTNTPVYEKLCFAMSHVLVHFQPLGLLILLLDLACKHTPEIVSQCTDSE